MAGPFGNNPPHVRSRKHYRVMKREFPRSLNLTSRDVPTTRVGAMKPTHIWKGKDFFDGWDFFTQPDPTHGQVDYVGRDTAFSKGLVTAGDVVTIAVDNTPNLPLGQNRQSVRITSKDTFNEGLIVLDALAIPSGCAVWPAFWTVGDNWPNNGEIDIVEGVNMGSVNQMTLHTGANPGCRLDTSQQSKGGLPHAFSGKVSGGTNCVSANGQNSGCGILGTESSFGSSVKKNGGMVYAMLRNSTGIYIWNFERSDVPADIASPDPSTWRVPNAFWASTACPSANFKDHKIVINTSLCGDWAGAAYGSSCPGTCRERVAKGPFDDAKWMIKSVSTFKY